MITINDQPTFGTTALATPTPIQTIHRNGGAPFVAQPCLMIAAGGIGHRIALALKGQLVSIFGQVPAGIRILVFDIDEENLSLRVGEQVVALERDVELFCLAPVPVARIKQNLKNLPTIEERLPSIHDLPPIAAVRAAKQVRPIGQLAYQWRFTAIRSAVQSALWQLAGRDHRGDDNLVVDPSRGIKVIEVGSNCGGTNSGMFMDLGFLVRSELEALGTLGDACTLIGIGMLPGAFRGVAGPNLVPNTVAALMELETVTMNGRQVLRYRDGTVIETARPPFDMYLLVDAVDEGGRVWVSTDDLCQMLARSILVMSASQLGEHGEGELDNLDEVLSQRTPEGHGTFFGSLGLSVLEFPADTIAELFTAQLSHDLVARRLLRSANGSAPGGLTWLQSQGLAPVALLPELARDDAGVPLAAVLDPPAALQRLPEHQVPQEAIQYVQAYARMRVDGDFRSYIRHNGQTLADNALRKLDEQVFAMVNDPNQGLVQCQGFLEDLANRLVELRSALTQRRQVAKSTESDADREVEQAAGELIKAPEAMWLVRRARVSASLDHYVQVCQASLTARLDGIVAEQALATVSALASRTGDHVRMLATLHGRLQAAAGLLAQDVQAMRRRLERRRGHPALVLVDLPYLEQMYQSHMPNLDDVLHSLLASLGRSGLFEWRVLDPEELARRLRQVGKQPFLPIQTLTIEQVLAEHGDFSPQARLAALLDEAQPAWNIDETRLPGGDASLRRITVVGVPDHTHSLFRAESRRLVSLHDPHTVLVLSLTVGAPFTALQAWPAYQAEYERARRLRPLHTLPAFQRESVDAGLALALGLIFGPVFSRGVYFYYRPADELMPEARLAQGVSNAVKALAARPDLMQETFDRVEAQIEHIGTRQALERLSAYYAAVAGDDDITRELKQAVRTYAETLQANARVASGH